jgi:hypothetical protein
LRQLHADNWFHPVTLGFATHPLGESTFRSHYYVQRTTSLSVVSWWNYISTALDGSWPFLRTWKASEVDYRIMALLDYTDVALQLLRTPDRSCEIQEGFGIQRRALRAQEFWRNHLERSRNFLSNILNITRPQSITVIGAGRLLDFPIESLPETTQSLQLVDIDPSCLRSWRTLGERLLRRSVILQPVIADSTGRIALLESELRSLLTKLPRIRAQELAEVVRSFGRTPPVRPQLESSSLVISLNILSQLGIGLQRTVNRILKELWRPPNTLDIAQITHELRKLIFQVEFEHLEGLASISLHELALLTDLEFIDYVVTEPEWKVQPALELPLPISVPSFKLAHSDQWLWHLAPQGLEFPDHGAIHRVGAAHFRRGSE